MDIPDNHILEFQELWKKHFGIEITKEQALEKGLRLIRLIEAVSRAVAQERLEAKNLEKKQGSLKNTDNIKNDYGHGHY